MIEDVYLEAEVIGSEPLIGPITNLPISLNATEVGLIENIVSTILGSEQINTLIDTGDVVLSALVTDSAVYEDTEL